jgi:hypothetical protein
LKLLFFWNKAFPRLNGYHRACALYPKKEKEEKGKGGGQTSIYAPSDKKITKKKKEERERGEKENLSPS